MTAIDACCDASPSPALPLLRIYDQEAEAASVSGVACLVLDARERALADALRARQAALRVEALHVGDVHVYDAVGGLRLIVERKTLPDLAASIRDGRFREQKARMRAAGLPAEALLYVLEGACGRFAFDAARMTGDRHGVGDAAMRGAVAALLLRDRVRVAFTHDVEDTAALLELALRHACGGGEEGGGVGGGDGASRLEAAACAAAAAGARKSAGLDPARCLLQQLCQIPRVSARIARALVADLGCSSMGELVGGLAGMPRAARVKRVAKVPGVGKKGAETICDFLFGAQVSMGIPQSNDEKPLV